MGMKFSKIGLILLLAGFGAGIAAISGCQPGGNTTTPEDLGTVEIRQYEGEDLSSIYDFRENSIKGPQLVDIDTYQLKISGLVETPQALTYDEVLNDYTPYKKVVTINCVEGWDVKLLWEGVLVRDLIATAGVLPESQIIIFHAYDGYTTSMPLEYFMDRDIMLAYKMNEVTLPPERGFPFELVAESKWGYKWIKWVTEIELSDDTDYQGFWEDRGYSNSADLNESFYGD